jgi:hypothetical protein
MASFFYEWLSVFLSLVFGIAILITIFMVFRAIYKKEALRKYLFVLPVLVFCFVCLKPGSKITWEASGLKTTVWNPSPIEKFIGQDKKFEITNTNPAEPITIVVSASSAATAVTLPLFFLEGNQLMKKIGESHDGNIYYYSFQGTIPPSGKVSGLSKDQIDIRPSPERSKQTQK